MTPNTGFTPDQEKVLETVAKLMRLGDRTRNTSPEEAAGAIAKAQEVGEKQIMEQFAEDMGG